MNIYTELESVTADIINARRALADLEAARYLYKWRVAEADAALSTARIALMARSDAGTNDTEPGYWAYDPHGGGR